jgi:hypothetical protein
MLVKKSVQLSNSKKEQAFAAAVKLFLKLDSGIFAIVISTIWTPNLYTASQKTRSGRIVKTRTFLEDKECK